MARGAWRPLLAGDLAARARRAVGEIARALAGPSSWRALGPSLSWGAAGPALFFGYLARSPGGEEGPAAADRYAELAALYLDEAVAGMARVPMSAGLFSGFPGVAWALEHLSRRLDGGEEPGPAGTDPDDPNAAIDQAIFEALTGPPWRGPFDLGRGLVGLGVYALERLPRASSVRCLEAIVACLAETATHEDRGTDRGTTWLTRPELLAAESREDEPQGVFDLGVAHGLPGVISLLAGASQVDACADRALPLLDGAVRWLLSLPRSGRPGFRVGKWLSRSTGRVMPARRLAWCYGDPGAAAALLYAARTVGDGRLEREALALATSAAKAPIEGSGVEEAGLCHGAVGVAHLFNRIYQATDRELFAAAARRWYRHGLDLQRPGQGIAGFGSPGAADDPGLFTGAAGVGLGLLAAVSDVEPEWDRLLGIAIPPRRSTSSIRRRTWRSRTS